MSHNKNLITIPDEGYGVSFNLALNPELKDAAAMLSSDQIRILGQIVMNQPSGENGESAPLPIPDNIELGQE